MNSQRSPVLLISAALSFALMGGCSRSALELHNQSNAPSNPEGGMQDANGGSDANGLCPAAGFVANRPLLGWSDGAAINLLFSNGEVRHVQPIPTSSPTPPTGIGALWLYAGRGGWSIAILGTSEARDETSQVAILRPDGSTLWRGKIQHRFPVVFAGPQGAVIDFADVLMFIDESGNAVERKKDVGGSALGGVGAAGEVPASWEERLADGDLLDHLSFVRPAAARTELPAVRRGRWTLVGETFHYVESVNGDLVWQRQGLTARATVLRVPNTADARLDHYGAWVVLSAGLGPLAVAREDGSDARLLPSPVASPPTYNVSANGDWLVGSAEFGAPIGV